MKSPKDRDKQTLMNPNNAIEKMCLSMQKTHVRHATVQKETCAYTVKHATVYINDVHMLLNFFQINKASKKFLDIPKYKSKERDRKITPRIKKEAKDGKGT